METVRKADKSGELFLVSEGSEISTGEEVEARLAAGATLTTTCNPFFLKKGPFAIYDIKRELVELRNPAKVKVASAARQ